MTGARRRPSDDGVLWGAVADTMTLVSAVFLIVFLAALLSYRTAEAARATAEAKYSDIVQGARAQRQVAVAALTAAAGDGIGVLPDGTLQLRESLLFATGSAELSEHGSAFIRGRLAACIAKVVVDRSQRVLIAGYTDAQPISGLLLRTFATNWELSAHRATIVLRTVLDAQPGIPAGSVYAAGFADTLPLAGVDPMDGQNRRVEIHLTGDGIGLLQE